MSLIITAELPDLSVKQLTLRPAQRARVGTSPWMELSLADSSLSESHFEIHYDPTPEIICIDSAKLDHCGELVSRLQMSTIDSGSTSFVAGRTRFEVVHVDTGFRANDGLTSVLRNAAPKALPDQRRISRQWCDEFEFEPEIYAAFAEHRLMVSGIRQLQSQEKEREALRMALRGAPASRGVAVVLEAILQIDSTSDQLANEIWVEAVRAWSADASDERRRHVSHLAVQERLTGWRKYLCEAVRFSGGSLTPDDQPVVRPAAKLPALALDVCLVLAQIDFPGLSLAGVIDVLVEAADFPRSTES